MNWILLSTIAAALGVAWLLLWQRRAEQEQLRRSLKSREDARTRGSDKARLQVPHVDLSRCIGCGTCVAACPEEEVLAVVHGQAVVVHGSRCVGHGLCAVECPVGAIAVTLGDLETRKDIPVLTESLEAPQSPGLFLAGELTGFALIRTAIEHGAAVAREVSARRNGNAGVAGQVLDLCIVGAGPAGIACSLEAKKSGLRHQILEREELGGTVAKYPRRKLVMTQPVELPLHGRLKRTTWTKEELLELWGEIVAEHELPLTTGAEFQGLKRDDDGVFRVQTSSGEVRAHHVCLALGRRGTPRKLGVSGEELTKVAYGLVDAQSFENRRILVVGGGDSAIEAAVGLAEQIGNRVSLSYRRDSFTRIKARNERQLQDAVAKGGLELILNSEVRSIEEGRVELTVKGSAEHLWIENDDVFVLAGGIPPFQLLENCGVSLDPADREASKPLTEQGTGLFRSVSIALVFAVLALGFTLSLREYFGIPRGDRPLHELHRVLGPGRGVGLGMGVAAALCMLTNLAYLLRRSIHFPLRFGSLQTWMTSHVATGVGALLLALVHAGLAPGDTAGGHALLGLLVLVATGVVGRYLYSFVPRAANGRELALDEVRARLARMSGAWDGHRGFGERVRERMDELTATRWQSTLPRRIMSLLAGERKRRRILNELRNEGRAEGVSERDLAQVMALAREAHRAAMSAAHLEDLRGLLGAWRWLHRWAALLVVLLVILHIVTAFRYGALDHVWASDAAGGGQ